MPYRAVFLAGLLLPAAVHAQAVVPGASLGLLIPAGGLSQRSSAVSGALLPAPTVAVHGRSVLPLLGVVPAWEVVVEAAQVRSDEDAGLRILFMNLQAAGLWEVAELEGFGIVVRGGAGPTLVSANRGSPRSVTSVMGSLGWLVRRELLDCEANLEAGIDVVLEREPEQLLHLRIVVLTQ